MKTIAMIPARSGSKGLPHKNIMHLCGKPLLRYTADAARDSGIFDMIYVNTDSKEYFDLAGEGAAYYKRPDYLAQDNTSMREVVSEFIKSFVPICGYDFEVFVLYPTYPLRSAQDIRDMSIAHENMRTMIGIKKAKTHPFMCRCFDNTIHNFRKFTKFDTNKYYRRQDYPVAYEITHFACIVPAKMIDNLDNQLTLESNDNMSRMQQYYEIEDDERAIDIDTREDFDRAESILQKENVCLSR